MDAWTGLYWFTGEECGIVGFSEGAGWAFGWGLDGYVQPRCAVCGSQGKFVIQDRLMDY